MGAVDLVLMVESPGAVSRGLQRVGRAGHQVGEASRGLIFPKHRGDLLEATVVARGMRRGEVEALRVPRTPLDVLAQQVVAMALARCLGRGCDARAAAPQRELRRSLARAARLGARHARGPLPVRGFRRAAAAPRLGSRARLDRRAPRREQDRAALGRHDPGSRPVWRASRRRGPAHRRARRGDGSRDARGRDHHARRVDLARRRDHARSRDREPGARRDGQAAVLARRRPGAPAGTRPRARRVPARARGRVQRRRKRRAQRAAGERSRLG